MTLIVKELVLGAAMCIIAGCATHAPTELAAGCPMIQVNGQWRCALHLPSPSAWKLIPDPTVDLSTP